MCQGTGTAAKHRVPNLLPSDPAQRALTAAFKDVTAQRREFLFGPPASWRPFLLECIHDPRDEPLLFLLLDVCCTTAPAAAALFCVTPSLPALAQHLLCAAYLAASFAAFLQRFLLGLHYSSHRPLFRRPWGLLNGLMPFALAPLFGVPCGIYSLHHCIMHHVVRSCSGLWRCTGYPDSHTQGIARLYSCLFVANVISLLSTGIVLGLVEEASSITDR